MEKGVEVDQESEEELRKGNLVKFMQNRPDIMGAAMPADECFTEDDEEGEVTDLDHHQVDSNIFVSSV